MNFETYKELLKDMDISITNEQIEQLNTYKEMLKEWNSVMDLTAICDDESIIEKHFYDSLLSYKIVNYDNQSLLDVGTGAGFPGLVLKIVFPSLKVTLLEPTTKRCKFLNAVIEKLKLTDIEVINERAEDFIKKNHLEITGLLGVGWWEHMMIAMALIRMKSLFVMEYGKMDIPINSSMMSIAYKSVIR